MMNLMKVWSYDSKLFNWLLKFYVIKAALAAGLKKYMQNNVLQSNNNNVCILE